MRANVPLSACFVPGPVLIARYTLDHLILILTLPGRSPFHDEKAKAQLG